MGIKKIICLIAVLVSLAALSVSGFQLVKYLYSGHEDLSEYYNSTYEETTSDSTPELSDNPIDFSALKTEKPDVCGWIRIDGTAIDYPVLRSGEDTAEGFYLNHGIDRVKKNTGSIYIEKLNSPNFIDPVTVIYGHNMRNGSMFAAATNYKNRDFFEQNPNIYIYTEGHILTYEVFSAFLYDDKHLMYSFDFYDAASYNEFLQTCLAPQSSIKNVRENAAVSTDDKIIVLSTCYAEDDDRFLVVARQISDTPTK